MITFKKYLQTYLSNNRRGMILKDSENVVAFIKGTEKPNEIVVISAHLDHEGIKNGKIYNGADDDGSGTVAILEIAEAFKKSCRCRIKVQNDLYCFLHVTGEEKRIIRFEVLH